jgi:hypothetical protein
MTGAFILCHEAEGAGATDEDRADIPPGPASAKEA